MDSLPKPKSAPASLGWIIAAISLVSVIYLARASIRTAGEIRQQLVYEEFSDALAEQDFGTAEKALAELSKPFGYTPAWLIAPKNSTDEDQRHIVDEFYQTVYSLSSDNFENAVLRFNDLRYESINKILYSMPPRRKNTALLRDLQIQFDAYHKNFVTLKEKIEADPRVVEDLNQRIKQQYELANELVQEVTELFSLPAEEAEKDGSIRFYEKGVLAGLPRLKGLSDNIKDLFKLKEKLERAGGSVTMRGENAAARFQKRLPELRESGMGYVESINQLKDEIRQNEERVRGLRKEVFDQGKSLQGKLIALLREILRPNLGFASRTILGRGAQA